MTSPASATPSEPRESSMHTERPAMRIDVVSIFPEYLQPLELSLVGKARNKGLVSVAVHNLRDWTTDRHRTVDDTPYGGGAGMVMKADVWGRALDETLSDDAHLLIPTPAGRVFDQRMAEELASDPHLVLACGRYEGIDSRVAQHYQNSHRVTEFSIGDYVLNGGESAALVLIEAVVRLLPEVLGNPESVVEESHNRAGTLEAPMYTKPSVWRGLEVPEVLASGNHALVDQWRKEQALRRTAQIRPDLLHKLNVEHLSVQQQELLAQLRQESEVEGEN